MKSTPIVQILEPFLLQKKVELYIKREDLNHPVISGNKLRKLKYNLLEACRLGYDTLLTFGGAFSNHIYAVAGAGSEFGFKTIGLIRGEEHRPLNHTLSFARERGMELHYIDRNSYRKKQEVDFLKGLEHRFGPFYLLPEGGTNELAIEGCKEMAEEIDESFHFVCCPVGTGGTLAGIIRGLGGRKKVIGFSSLKGDFLTNEVSALVGEFYENWNIENDYHFGGYAKIKPELINFILDFEQKHQIPLEPIYTGKMLYGIYDLIGKGGFPTNSKILALHTGGLQGNLGFSFRKSLQR